MTDPHCQDDETIVFDAGNNPVVSYSVLPKLCKGAMEPLTDATRILEDGDAIPQEISDSTRCFIIEPLQLPGRCVGQLNRPSQGVLLPRPTYKFALSQPVRAVRFVQPRTHLPSPRGAARLPDERNRSWYGHYVVPACQGVFRWIVAAGSQAYTPRYMSIAHCFCTLPIVLYTSRFTFISSRYFTTLPTFCECSRVVMSNASPVSTTTRPFTPTAATNFAGE
jgi:hypothetical protein